MSKFKKGKAGLPKTRKELRKEKRKEKKVKRHEYYTNRKKPGQFVLNPNKNNDCNDEKQGKPIIKTTLKKQNVLEPKPTAPAQNQQVLSTEKVREKEKKEQDKLEKEMTKQRNKQLLEANLEEDRAIKRLEKQLKLNKRKSKSVPKSFAEDGLDYLLEVCDSESMKSSVLAEQQLNEVNDEFEEDLALMTGEAEDETSSNKRKSKTDQKQQKKKPKLDESDDDDFSNEEEVELESEEELLGEEEAEFDSEEELLEEEELLNSPAESDAAEEDETNENSELSDAGEEPESLKKPNRNEDGTWEDIYGRLRSEDGSVIQKTAEKYVPPAIRARLESSSDDKARTQKLERLRKQLKGYLNRLAESNMHSIATQIEALYMNNSRNDMNNTITNLILEAIVCESLSPEQLLQNNVLLITVLHANVGTEVGAHFLQTVAKKFDEFIGDNAIRNIENKKLDNVVNIIAQLYNFKLFDAKLVYQILDRLCRQFEEKDVECILHILRSIGFGLRKDNPLELKNLILNLQKRAAQASDEVKENARVKFMLDILLAIKNNNVTKIPNYDTKHSEHLKKIMKGFIRKGNYVTQLNISLEDLIKAEERGRWWVVGSAWAGNDANSKETDLDASEESANSFSQKLLELARKQRMNTDARKNIFCIIMSAEDYLDAFEKLLKLSLKNQQDREIIHVLLHCCLQEKKYNPYYSVLAQKFCEYDRKYQMTIKYSIWDKLKALNDHSATQISNLAKLLSHLFMEKGLPISTLKVVEFGELDKLTLRFMRQVLLAILLNENADDIKDVFDKVAQSDKLKMFRESLRLFIHHFLLRNLESHSISQEKKDLLQERAKIVDKILTRKSVKF